MGVDLNTASVSLLEHISGISRTIAKNIVAYREENGAFTDRKQLLKVPKLGPKAFEQCAGFMRISGGADPLDATSVHPESYRAARELLERLGLELDPAGFKGMAGLGTVSYTHLVPAFWEAIQSARGSSPRSLAMLARVFLLGR